MKKGNIAAALATSVCIVAMAVPAQAQTREYQIPAGSLKSTLDAYARQSERQVIYKVDDIRRARSPGAKGNLTPEAALNAILNGTGFTFRTDSSGAIAIISGETGAGSAAADNESADIVVTGSHIRGGNPTSPVRTVGRKEVEESGYSTIGELVRSLPENFSGGQNPGIFSANNTKADNTNASGASTVNLRGLGTDATLILLNGHRMTADSIFGGVDISVIPLSVIQRVEIMTDGGSAVYGSDAVAGVANFITRRDYKGVEASARIGGATQGGGLEQTYSILAGTSGNNGYALVSLEYSDQDAITASQRDFTSLAMPDNTIYPSISKKSVFLSAGRDITEGVSVSLDAGFNYREMATVLHVSPTSKPNIARNETPNYFGTVSADIDLGGEWKAHAAGGASGSLNRSAARLNTTPTFSSYKNDIQYIEVSSDGPLVRLPSGEVKVAIGGGYRREGFSPTTSAAFYSYNVSRNVNYFYAEVQLPVVQPSSTRAGLNELDLSFSGRTEEYSDFGRSTNPKVGLRYMPFSAMTLRGTWGTSFKAPVLYQMYEPRQVYLYDANLFTGYTGAGVGMVNYGGNTELQPEKSTSWTVGADFSPSAMKTAKLSLTYFNTHYRNRILTEPVNNIVAAISNPIYAPYIEMAPSLSRANELASEADLFFNYSSLDEFDPATVAFVVQDKTTNATSQELTGLDVAYRQEFSLPGSTLAAFANATWLTLKQQYLPGTPNATLSGTIYNVPKFKARGGVSWTRAGFSATAIVNHVAGEDDNAVSPTAKISSWTTADMTVAYKFSKGAGWANGLRAALSISNLFDQNPPRTTSSVGVSGIYYDSANASIVGRFVSLTITKAW